jgi:hypothetical protein
LHCGEAQVAACRADAFDGLRTSLTRPDQTVALDIVRRHRRIRPWNRLWKRFALAPRGVGVRLMMLLVERRPFSKRCRSAEINSGIGHTGIEASVLGAKKANRNDIRACRLSGQEKQEGS